MVLPNALLAFYYGWRKQPEVVYASQVGDAHVSIPLCLGVFTLYHWMPLPPLFSRGHVHPAWRDTGASVFCGGLRKTAARRRACVARGLSVFF